METLDVMGLAFWFMVGLGALGPGTALGWSVQQVWSRVGGANGASTPRSLAIAVGGAVGGALFLVPVVYLAAALGVSGIDWDVPLLISVTCGAGGGLSADPAIWRRSREPRGTPAAETAGRAGIAHTGEQRV